MVEETRATMAVQLAVGATARNDAGIAAALPVLRQRFGERFADSEAVRRQHGHQTTWLVNEPPDAVVFPEIDRRGRRDRAHLRAHTACR